MGKYCRHTLDITKLVIFHYHGIKSTKMVFEPIPQFFIQCKGITGSSTKKIKEITKKLLQAR